VGCLRRDGNLSVAGQFEFSVFSVQKPTNAEN